MVLPYDIQVAADEANLAVVEAWLDEAGPGAVNDRDQWGFTLLLCCMKSSINERHVQFARMLIARGADVNIGKTGSGSCPLHYACFPGDCSSTMVSLLLKEGARVDERTNGDRQTPLGQLIDEFDYCLESVSEADEMPARQRQISRSGLEIMISLLRAGASLESCQYGYSAEDLMQEFLSRRPSYANDESFARCQELVAGVRVHGSYKSFAREPHRQFLRLRSLLVRGRAKVRGSSKTSRRLEGIARLPNGACWHVISFWRDAG